MVVIFTFLIDYTAVLLSGLVFKYLEFHRVATLMEAEHDTIVCRDAVEVLLGLEGLD